MMLRIRLIAIVAALLSVLAGSLIVQSAQPSAAYVPVLRSPRAVDTPPIVLVSHDIGLIDATLTQSGAIVVAYQDRSERGKVHLTVLSGDHLVELPLSAVQQGALNAAPAPADVLPGDKQGAVSSVAVDGVLYVFFTARDTGDTTGNFRLRLLTTEAP
jgi:hypothetical protein